MTNVLVLGGSGMLGSMIVDVLSQDSRLSVTATVRDERWREHFRGRYPNVQWLPFDGGSDRVEVGLFHGQQWIVNAIGITKPLIRDDRADEIEQAIDINSRLPHRIGHAAAAAGARVLQIATDCVYSGKKGRYLETDPHDALDVYGKTKSLGETYQPNVHHLRCSIIGPEPKDFKFLIEWFRRQPTGAHVNGFTNHQWNGVGTLQFAQLCRGAILGDVRLEHLLHVVPSGFVSKADMLREFAVAYGRGDITVTNTAAATVLDRTLSTINESLNMRLWQAAGYERPPTVPEMIRGVAAYEYRAI